MNLNKKNNAENIFHASLFSGIGGFDLAAEWMGWENVFHCEWNEFSQKILKYHFPKAITYNDITKTDFTFHRGKIDILTGGFPCQPYSTAGKRLGKQDERHLWPEMCRAIREIQPSYVVAENVSGLTNWNGGVVFDEVQADLEAEGYEVLAFLLPACAVNAPHRRDRIWFIAYSASNGRKRKGQKIEIEKGLQPRPESTWELAGRFEGLCSNGNATITNWKQTADGDYSKFPTQSPLCGGNDGLPSELDGITIYKWRSESIKAFGNAIVPQVAHEIFKCIDFCIKHGAFFNSNAEHMLNVFFNLKKL